jgi:ABC-2 type transport system ATP-binding protein
LSLIKELGQKHTILLSTHILSEVEAVCQRVIIISFGRIGLAKNLAELGQEAASISLEVRGPTEQVTDVLWATGGVSTVAVQPLEDGLNSYEIHTQHNQDLRELLSQRMAKNGWAIRRLDLRRRRLEDHFVDVVVRQDNPFVTAPAPTVEG